MIHNNEDIDNNLEQNFEEQFMEGDDNQQYDEEEEEEWNREDLGDYLVEQLLSAEFERCFNKVQLLKSRKL